jgi:predicted nucleic acid-binding protein
LRFWDSSALAPLIVRQQASGWLRALYRSDDGVFAWWGAWVECESAISRLEREGRLQPRSAMSARQRLGRFVATWHEVQPSDPLRDDACRMLRVHDLRAADALQLAAGVAAAERRPATLAFVCLDERLAAAGEREGFRVIREAPPPRRRENQGSRRGR